MPLLCPVIFSISLALSAFPVSTLSGQNLYVSFNSATYISNQPSPSSAADPDSMTPAVPPVCPATSRPCVAIGETDWCCEDTMNCAFDAVGAVGCCPIGAQCRGLVGQAVESGSNGGSEITATSSESTVASTETVPVGTRPTLVPGPFGPVTIIQSNNGGVRLKGNSVGLLARCSGISFLIAGSRLS